MTRVGQLVRRFIFSPAPQPRILLLKMLNLARFLADDLLRRKKRLLSFDRMTLNIDHRLIYGRFGFERAKTLRNIQNRSSAPDSGLNV